MLKIVKGHLETIDGVEVYPIISLLIFFFFFCGLFLWAVGVSRQHIQDMKELPLETDTEPNQKI